LHESLLKVNNQHILSSVVYKTLSISYSVSFLVSYVMHSLQIIPVLHNRAFLTLRILFSGHFLNEKLRQEEVL